MGNWAAGLVGGFESGYRIGGALRQRKIDKKIGEAEKAAVQEQARNYAPAMGLTTGSEQARMLEAQDAGFGPDTREAYKATAGGLNYAANDPTPANAADVRAGYTLLGKEFDAAPTAAQMRRAKDERIASIYSENGEYEKGRALQRQFAADDAAEEDRGLRRRATEAQLKNYARQDELAGTQIDEKKRAAQQRADSEKVWAEAYGRYQTGEIGVAELMQASIAASTAGGATPDKLMPLVQQAAMLQTEGVTKAHDMLSKGIPVEQINAYLRTQGGNSAMQILDVAPVTAMVGGRPVQIDQRFSYTTDGKTAQETTLATAQGKMLDLTKTLFGFQDTEVGIQSKRADIGYKNALSRLADRKPGTTGSGDGAGGATKEQITAATNRSENLRKRVLDLDTQLANVDSKTNPDGYRALATARNEAYAAQRRIDAYLESAINIGGREEESIPVGTPYTDPETGKKYRFKGGANTQENWEPVEAPKAGGLAKKTAPESSAPPMRKTRAGFDTADARAARRSAQRAEELKNRIKADDAAKKRIGQTARAPRGSKPPMSAAERKALEQELNGLKKTTRGAR